MHMFMNQSPPLLSHMTVVLCSVSVCLCLHLSLSLSLSVCAKVPVCLPVCLSLPLPPFLSLFLFLLPPPPPPTPAPRSLFLSPKPCSYGSRCLIFVYRTRDYITEDFAQRWMGGGRFVYTRQGCPESCDPATEPPPPPPKKKNPTKKLKN